MAFVKVLIIITIVFNGQNNLEAKSLGLVTNDPGKTNIEDNDNGRRNIDSSSYSKTNWIESAWKSVSDVSEQFGTEVKTGNLFGLPTAITDPIESTTTIGIDDDVDDKGTTESNYSSNNWFESAWKTISDFFEQIGLKVESSWKSVVEFLNKITTEQWIGLCSALITCIFIVCSCVYLPSLYPCILTTIGDIFTAIINIILCIISAPFILITNIIGFTIDGVAAGSCASTVQSCIGNVVPGSCFSRLQSYGARRGYGSI